MKDGERTSSPQQARRNCTTVEAVDDLDDYELYQLNEEEDEDEQKTEPITNNKEPRAAGGEVLRPGDHIYMWCTLYQHHGIVLDTRTTTANNTGESNNPNEDGKSSIANVQDVNGTDTEPEPTQATTKHPETTSTDATVVQNQTPILLAEFTNVALTAEGNNGNFLGLASTGSQATSSPVGVTGGFRILREANPSQWHVVKYRANQVECWTWRPGTCSGSEPSPVVTILQRVQFLQECGPHRIPNYHLLACNCETVAVWCVTGKWETLQADRALQLSQLGATSLALTGFGLAAGLAAGGLAVCHSLHINQQWQETAAVLNKEFEWYQMGGPPKFSFRALDNS